MKNVSQTEKKVIMMPETLNTVFVRFSCPNNWMIRGGQVGVWTQWDEESGAAS